MILCAVSSLTLEQQEGIVLGYVCDTCSQMTQTVPKAIVHCMVLRRIQVWTDGDRWHREARYAAGCVCVTYLRTAIPAPAPR